ncbi:MAG: hypothetical protein B6D46_10965 [Polyangiaceae bacterium UTPRO1]|jgi:flagellar FliL protein|nr:flagellar basal body-associated FliL family protein [Myxococcales bacterium]OQY66338.1 MAG: hypothetical protein B6D46_10965 [Polyangiaceae bacterium UTPRO1]
MAEEAEKPAAEEAQKKSKLVPMLGGGIAVSAAAAFALWYLGIGPFAGGPPRQAEATAAVAADGGTGAGGAAEKEPRSGEKTSLLSLDPFIANLADDGGRRYLKATFQIDFGSADVPAAMQARLPQTRDLLLTLFTSKTYDEIRTPEGKQQLREEIIARINQVLDRDLVKAVYFTEFIVQ